MIEAIVFDVGETLIDESREYGTWADWLGVPRHTFSAVFGAVIALGMAIGIHSGISAPTSVLMPSVRGVPTRESQNGLVRMIFIRTRGHAWRRCAIWASG
jgi:hypothetical protein